MLQQKPQTYIFFGRSGSGKGTQAELLIKYLQEQKREVLYIETGRVFREFMEQDSYSARLTREMLSGGGLLPVFLPVWIWE